MPQWVYRSTTTAPGGLVGAGAGASVVQAARMNDVAHATVVTRHRIDRIDLPLPKYAMSSTIADTESAGSLLLLTIGSKRSLSASYRRVTGSVPRLPGDIWFTSPESDAA